jgi:hypothetical protein
MRIEVERRRWSRPPNELEALWYEVALENLSLKQVWANTVGYEPQR